MYAAQSGVGAAEPTQTSCCVPVERPVLSIAVPIVVAFGVLWKTPMPPRSTARGPRMPPSKPATCWLVPYVHEKPMRGLRYALFGTRSLRALNSRSTSELNCGPSVKWLPSTRRPYCTCRSSDGRYESPSDRPRDVRAFAALARRELPRERRRPTRVEIGQRVERERAELIRRQVLRVLIVPHLGRVLDAMLVVLAEPRQRVHELHARLRDARVHRRIAAERHVLHARRCRRRTWSSRARWRSADRRTATT